jgi:hypothetical protein
MPWKEVWALFQVLVPDGSSEVEGVGVAVVDPAVLAG